MDRESVGLISSLRPDFGADSNLYVDYVPYRLLSAVFENLPFYEQLEQLNEFVKEEWAGKGNRVQDFKEKGPKIIIILDNASYQKKQEIIDKIAQNIPNIMLEFLPEYSPDYNIIELVWHLCKEYIAHRLFKSVDELKDLLDRLLNEGELIIKWHRKIKNKGNNHIAA